MKNVHTLKTTKVQIRWMIRRDMREVLKIENESFEFNWTEEEFLSCLRLRNCIGMVAEHDNRVVGFMIYELHKTRLHILNFAVSRVFRRLAVGRQMIDKLIYKLSQQRRQKIVVEVRESNLPMQLFLKACNFKSSGVLRGHYEESEEDAYQFVYTIDGTEPVLIPVEQVSCVNEPVMTTIRVSATTDELAAWHSAARQAGMTLGDFIRSVLNQEER